MYDFHTNKEIYFNIQYKTSKDYIIPFIEKISPVQQEYKILEIGCAEAGVLKAFTDLGNKCVGIELSASRIELANSFMSNEVESGSITFLAKDIYDVDIEKDLDHKFDIILLKDVIEHIPNQEKFINRLSDFLSENGKVFFGFPPWQMPFGGHQQICRNKFLMYLPYFHLLPMGIYKWILKLFGESDATIAGLVEIKETGISIERFERILKDENFKVLRRQIFFLNPIYKYKFGLGVRYQLSLISAIPVLRNFLSTCVYYLIEKK